jgi:hypothetical protein
VGKFALIQHQRYAHAKQFKRANRMLKKLRTLLGRVIRDIARKIEGDGGLEAHLRPKARGNACNQAPTAPQVSRRTRDRLSQSRAPYGPQLSLVLSGRCCQRRPLRRRLQLPPPDPMAQAFVVPYPRRPDRRASARSSLKTAFFTDD